MPLQIFQVDAFTDSLFCGNPAAVVPLDGWLPDETMQAIAAENNLSETVFFVPDDRPDIDFHLRWFSPTTEVELCGHATLATAFVLFDQLVWQRDVIRFSCQVGVLVVERDGDGLILDFPSTPPTEATAPQGLADALGQPVVSFWQAGMAIALLQDEAAVLAARPDMDFIAALPSDGLIITAAGRECDFVSRYFAPASGISEDPVTGSAHCRLAPFWAAILGKTTFTARQVSERGGDLMCWLLEDRVRIKGKAVLYMTGQIVSI